MVNCIYLIIFIVFIHSTITLLFCDYFTGIFDNDLMSSEAAIGPYTITAIRGLDYLNTNPILSPAFPALSQLGERTVVAEIPADGAVGVIALIQHNFVLAVVIATRFRAAYAFRRKAVKQI